MIFIDEQHKEFYKKLQRIAGDDVYSNSVIYLLGLSRETRKNFKTLFNIEKKKYIQKTYISPGKQVLLIK